LGVGQTRVCPSPQNWKLFIKQPTDVLIYHYSRGWDPGLDLLRELESAARSSKYHNVTPPEFLAGYNLVLAAMCLKAGSNSRSSRAPV